MAFKFYRLNSAHTVEVKTDLDNIVQRWGVSEGELKITFLEGNIHMVHYNTAS